jgi:hypothetical protein
MLAQTSNSGYGGARSNSRCVTFVFIHYETTDLFIVLLASYRK